MNTPGATVRMARNAGVLMAMELGMRVLEVATGILLARYLAPAGFGLMAFAMAFVSIFGIASEFGLSQLVTRDLARAGGDTQRYLDNGLLARVGLSTVAVGAVAVVMAALGLPEDRRIVVWLALPLVLLEDVLDFATAFFRAQQRMGIVALLNIAVPAGSLALIWWVICRAGGVAQILGARGVMYALVTLATLWLVHRRVRPFAWTYDWAFTRRMLLAAAAFVLLRFFVEIYVTLDTVMLSLIRGDEVTGWYAVAQKFRRIFSFIPTSVLGALLPALAAGWHDAPAALAPMVARSCRYLLLVALPVTGGLCVVAARVVTMLYGEAYAPAIPALQLLMWSMVPSFVNCVLTAALIAVGRERQVAWMLGAAALVSVGANLAAIPRWGHVGVSATKILVEGLVLVLQALAVRRCMPLVRPLDGLIPALAATGAMMLCAWWTNHWPLSATIAVGTVVDAVALLASRAVGAEEWRFLRRVLRRSDA